MNSRAQWLLDLRAAPSAQTVDGLVPVDSYSNVGRPPEEVAIMEKARAYKAQAVFFEAARGEHPPVAQAFVFVSNGPDFDERFADLHRRLWSWGGVPLLYRVTPAVVQLFRCAHRPDFEREGEIVFRPYKTLKLASDIASDPWWDSER